MKKGTSSSEGTVQATVKKGRLGGSSEMRW